MVYYYNAKNLKNRSDGSWDMTKKVKIWPFDLVAPADQSFWDIDIWVILNASIASKVMLKIKNYSENWSHNHLTT